MDRVTRQVVLSWTAGAVLVALGVALSKRPVPEPRASSASSGSGPCESDTVDSQRVGGEKNPCRCTIRIEPG